MISYATVKPHGLTKGDRVTLNGKAEVYRVYAVFDDLLVLHTGTGVTHVKYDYGLGAWTQAGSKVQVERAEAA